VDALKINQLAGGGMPPACDSMRYLCMMRSIILTTANKVAWALTGPP